MAPRLAQAAGSTFEAVLELVAEAAEGSRKLVDDGVLTGVDSLTSLVPKPFSSLLHVS